MKLKKLILNLLKLAFAILLFSSFMGCASDTTTTSAGGISSPEGKDNDIEDGISVDGGNQGDSNDNDSDNQLRPSVATFFIENRYNQRDTGSQYESNPNTLKIEGATGVATAEIDGKHYLFVTGKSDNGFSMFRIADDGTLMNTTNVSNGGGFKTERSIWSHYR